MITADRDRESLLLAIVANPGDLVTRMALADHLLHSSNQGEEDIASLRRPGRWTVGWSAWRGRYMIFWHAEPWAVTAGYLRRKHAPRCGRCQCYQPIAGPRTGWQWRCRGCLQDIGRRKLYLDNLAHVCAIAASNPSFRPVADRMVANDRYLTCPICAGAGLVGASLCSLCGATGELAQVSSP